jgi:hypothetical protein
MARLHFCNIVSRGAVESQLWQFNVSNGEIQLETERSQPVSTRFPARLVSKDWRGFWQAKINLAWLPPEQVFLRVTRLPTDEPSEVAPMLELQLEKLSPLPLNQIVWSYELLPKSRPNELTAIVVIVARGYVDDYLSGLETQGYLADRLELPFLHQLVTTPFDHDGAWVYPSSQGDRIYCLVAWWYGGTLQSVNLLNLPGTDQWAQVLDEELAKMAWAGEIEGWLEAAPRFTLVAEPALAARWQPVLQTISNQPVAVLDALPERDLAALNARRVAGRQAQVNLLPAEFGARYRQQFIDRLWMRSLGAAMILYLVGVTIYFGILQWVKFQERRFNDRIAAVAADYGKAQELKARIQILRDQVNLKFAGLDCWRATIETLPTELNLTTLNFQGGQKLTLTGTAPGDQDGKVTDYAEALSKYTQNNTPIFKSVNLKSSSRRGSAQGPQTVWTIDCEIRRSEL